MSGMLPTDEQEFLFSLQLPDEIELSSSQRLPSMPRVFILAVAASLAIHLAFFQWYVPSLESVEHKGPARRIQITFDRLTSTTPVKQLDKESFVGTSDEPPPDEPQPDEPQPEALAVPEAEIVDTIIVQPNDLPQQSNQQDFKTVITQQNRYRDDYLPPANLNTTLTTSHEPAMDDRPFSNVFDSRLRTRLQSASARSANEKSVGPRTSINTYGENVVELDNGSCMKSAPVAIGQPINWYLTTCVGGKSESEQMMERVNIEVNSRKLPP